MLMVDISSNLAHYAVVDAGERRCASSGPRWLRMSARPDEVKAFFRQRNIGSPMNDAPPHPWGWTQERRARQAAAIHSWRPWDSATGPSTSVGKAISSRNADRPNSARRRLNAIVAELNRVKRLLRDVAERREV